MRKKERRVFSIGTTKRREVDRVLYKPNKGNAVFPVTGERRHLIFFSGGRRDNHCKFSTGKEGEVV